jgi:DNA polymerase-4
MGQAWIVHLDMDSFYVSVERLKNPALNNKPVAVGGLGPRSVISSASYEARKFGVHSAMATTIARRLCPSLVMVAPSFKDYQVISAKIFGDLKNLAPLFQQISIDEAYFDFTGCEKIYPEGRLAWGAEIKNRVFQLSGLNCSIGIASNKMMAKIASDFCKPNSLLEIPFGTEERFLSPLPIGKIPGIGKKTNALLQAHGILNCADLVSRPDHWIHLNLGSWGFEWRDKAKGICCGKVEEEGFRKSSGAEQTFSRDIGDLKVLKKILLDLVEDLGFDLRRENLLAQNIQIKMRYPDFSTCTRAITLKEPTDNTLEIAQVAFRLLEQHKNKTSALRLLGVRLASFCDKKTLTQQPVQLDFFSDFLQQNKKLQKLDAAKDVLKTKFGKDIFLSQIAKK